MSMAALMGTVRRQEAYRQQAAGKVAGLTYTAVQNADGTILVTENHTALHTLLHLAQYCAPNFGLRLNMTY